MKKVIFTLLISFLFIIPIYAEQCTVVSGSGKEIGDEIKCGTEHFYVMEYTNSKIKMLAKYNLYMGSTYYKVSAETQNDCNVIASNNGGFRLKYDDNTKTCYYVKEITNITSSMNEDSCSLTDSNGNKLYVDGHYTTENYVGKHICKYYSINNGYDIDGLFQNPIAIGAHGDKKGEPEFPEVAVSRYPIHGISVDVSNDYYGSHTLRGYEMRDYLIYIEGYKNSLSSIGIDVEVAKLSTLEDIDRVIYKVSNRSIVKTWDVEDEDFFEDGFHAGYATLDNLKNYVSDNYSWLYSTTYWLGTESTNGDEMFIDTLGALCTGTDCDGVIGAGIRPLVTINNTEIVFPLAIESHTNGHGSIEVVPNAYENDVVTFRVIPKNNYKISSIKVISKTGEVITFTEEDIIENKDGTISINNFTMPAEDVTIEAVFSYEVINPKTKDTVPYIGLMIILLISIGFIIWSNKKIDIKL